MQVSESPLISGKGRTVQAKMTAASRIVDVGSPIDPGRFSLLSIPELDEVGRPPGGSRILQLLPRSRHTNDHRRAGYGAAAIARSYGSAHASQRVAPGRMTVDGFVVARAAGTMKSLRAQLTGKVT